MNNYPEVAWRQRARKLLIDVMGNRCVICGFTDDFAGAYDIHHPDPAQKEISFGKLSTLGVRRCLEEAKKCLLLCAICHRKVHAGLVDIVGILPHYDEELARRYLSFTRIPSNKKKLAVAEESRKEHTCKNCGQEIYRTAILCRRCADLAKQLPNKPSQTTLKKEHETLSITELARSYGVSHTTIKRWLTAKR